MTPRRAPPNLLLISADSLRVDRLAPWSPSAGVSVPNLESLAARGTLFRNAWAVAPWTAPAMVSVFSGLYPPSHGVVVRDDTTPRDLSTLPRLLAARGYELGNFTFFSQISYFRNLGLPSQAAGLRHGRETEALAAWLESRSDPRPFFAWIHLLEPHLPYGSSGYRAAAVQTPGSSGLEQAQLRAAVPVGTGRFVNGDRQRLLSLYDADVTRLDQAVGRILALLAEHSLEAETVVVFLADHGEELLEHGWVGHASTAIEAKLVPEILRIPLILAGPGIPSGQVSEALVQQVDLLPALVPLLDLPEPAHQDGMALPFETEGQAARGTSRLQVYLKALLHAEAPRRRRAYFDSAVGGNLTPRERIDERLQGITDGDCLLVSHRVPAKQESSSVVVLGGEPAGSCGGPRRNALEAELEGWRQEQLGQRLAILQQEAGPQAPAPALIAGFAEAITIRQPTPRQTLRWQETGGQIVLEWQAGAPPHWVEYAIGRPPTLVTGSFEVDQTRIVFGPFPQGFWNDLAGYSPFRFRVVDPKNAQRSAWVEFDVGELVTGDGGREP